MKLINKDVCEDQLIDITLATLEFIDDIQLLDKISYQLSNSVG